VLGDLGDVGDLALLSYPASVALTVLGVGLLIRDVRRDEDPVRILLTGCATLVASAPAVLLVVLLLFADPLRGLFP
jgi:hypothetical protein